MKVFKPSKANLDQAVQSLKSGGVVVYPTDTAYALGGIFNSKKVISKILKIKNRKDKKFTIIASSFSQADKFFKLNPAEKKLAKKFWPGPLSIAISNQFAVRVPKNKIARALARRVGKPLIATSANISGEKTLYDSKKIINQFKNKKNCPDLMIDAGQLLKTKTSTIVSVKKQNLKILRQGSIKISQQ